LIQKKQFELGRSALVSTFSSRNYFKLSLLEVIKNNVTRCTRVDECQSAATESREDRSLMAGIQVPSGHDQEVNKKKSLC